MLTEKKREKKNADGYWSRSGWTT